MGGKLGAAAILLGAIVLSGLAVATASATFNGHFTSEIAHTFIKGTEEVSTGHFLRFQETKGGETQGLPIICAQAIYDGTVTSATTQVVEVTPTHTKCRTDGGAVGSVTIHPNGCTYTVRSRTAPGDATVAVHCPAGKTLEITHPNCVLKVPAQFATASGLTGGATFTTIEMNGKHALTLDLLVNSVTTHFESGVCVFMGTTHAFRLWGSVTAAGSDKSANPVSITAT